MKPTALTPAERTATWLPDTATPYRAGLLAGLAPLRTIVARLAAPNLAGTIFDLDYLLDCGHIVSNDGRQAKAHKRCWKCLHRVAPDVVARNGDTA